MGERGILYWKQGDAPNARPDFGPAWVIEADGTERPINSGDWITRDEAARLAEVGDYIFDAEESPATK